MRILVCPDKFKGSLSAVEAAAAMREGILLAEPQAEVIEIPLSDGGEGTAEILTRQSGGRMVEVAVHDPLFRPITASYGLSGDGTTAFIEMARASGLPLLQPEERNCFHTSTYGTGELILAAIGQGATKIILGIGGSATNDAGIGMAAALGYRFLDAAGQPLEPIGKNLPYIHRIADDSLLFEPGVLQVQVACDVDNALSGPDGAAWVYGPQKGAGPEELAVLDQGLAHFGRVVEAQWGRKVAEVPGAGAAGGLGAGALVFLGATLERGIALVLAQTKLAERLAGVDLVLTGEGKLDQQTLQGKVIQGLCALVKPMGIPVAALCGTLAISARETVELGLSYASSVLQKPAPLEEAQAEAAALLREATFQVIRFFRSGRNSGI